MIAMLLLIIFCAQPVFAEVYTTEKTEGLGDCIYVAGSPDHYPVEFYDEENNAYCGIIPDMLGIISERSGVDFVYINGNQADKNTMGENLQVEMVSSSENINTLRLWQCEAEEELDFNAFNNQDYLRALDQKNKAEDITRVLYPNDSTWEGKRLRIKQQYVLSSASLQDILKDHLKKYGTLDNLADKVVVHINDTHPTLCIPELMRAESMKITPMGMLSRAEAGLRGGTLIVNLPGSEKAARECLNAVIKPIKHGIDVLRGESYDCAEIHKHRHHHE